MPRKRWYVLGRLDVRPNVLKYQDEISGRLDVCQNIFRKKSEIFQEEIESVQEIKEIKEFRKHFEAAIL